MVISDVSISLANSRTAWCGSSYVYGSTYVRTLPAGTYSGRVTTRQQKLYRRALEKRTKPKQNKTRTHSAEPRPLMSQNWKLLPVLLNKRRVSNTSYHAEYGSAPTAPTNNNRNPKLTINLQGRPKNWGHFVLRLVTSEILIRSASNLASIKVILFLTFIRNLFESTLENKVVPSSKWQ